MPLVLASGVVVEVTGHLRLRPLREGCIFSLLFPHLPARHEGSREDSASFGWLPGASCQC